MDKLNVLFFVIILFLLRVTSCFAQGYSTLIGTTYVDYATAYNNGYKIVPVGSFEDTLYTVYSYNDSTCYFAYSYDRGKTWKSQSFFATLFGNAHYPSIDVYNSLPYIVLEGDSAGKGEIFLKCPFDRCSTEN